MRRQAISEATCHRPILDQVVGSCFGLKNAQADPNRQRLYGEKQLRQQAAKKAEPGASHTKGCWNTYEGLLEVCGSKKPQVAAVATPDSRGEVKPKVVGAAADMDEATAAPVLRTLECAINGLKATTLLDIGADQSLDTAIELGGFLECMKLQVDRDVKQCLTFETAEATT
ncbi:hypothetical protein H257_09303 [Aphanomyces astaci]|uniref:Uncharacterized protein n=1 Tax=Aphanomyces astaci TaxID=112090 RepID=W4GC50_APHAT|nr:hypothetical protein H257_09303 [Aphanomyces astaci]ETV76866.1 hypothetical protein H257_09303 [Aphanomyces astaci]|eukprot:XP_009833778.1 hypothetical protein H257_09303 [Aphanomyces astaci]